VGGRCHLDQKKKINKQKMASWQKVEEDVILKKKQIIK
jgi:hypothetical protein